MGGHAARPCAGEAAVTDHKSVLQTGTTDPARSHSVGVTSDEAENPPRLRVGYGEDSLESEPPLKRRVKTHTAKSQDSSTPVPWRWRSRGARIRGWDRPMSQTSNAQPTPDGHSCVGSRQGVKCGGREDAHILAARERHRSGPGVELS